MYSLIHLICYVIDWDTVGTITVFWHHCEIYNWTRHDYILMISQIRDWVAPPPIGLWIKMSTLQILWKWPLLKKGPHLTKLCEKGQLFGNKMVHLEPRKIPWYMIRKRGEALNPIRLNYHYIREINAVIGCPPPPLLPSGGAHTGGGSRDEHYIGSFFFWGGEKS